MRDAVRLALGTLTILPVRPPARVDRRTAGRAMLLAPLVGLLVAVAVGAVLLVLGARAGCSPEGLTRASPLLAAVASVALVAVLTRGLHLDGLADTADGLGSGAPRERALAIMRGGDVGPFGVATLVLVLLLQVAALSSLFARGTGVEALATALVVSRLALPLACVRGVPAARASGLGSAVAGSVSRLGLVGVGAAVLVVAAVLAPGGTACASRSLATGDASAAAVLGSAASVLVPLLVAGALCHRCVRRLGGVTGDVLGACVELAFTTCVILLAVW